MKVFRIFASRMKQGHIETFKTRIISTTFVVVALAVFKPFGMRDWQWQAYIHLIAIWVMGIITCLITDVILKYIVRKPRSYDKGISYILRRNFWFQFINTPLITLFICLYRHFILNQIVEGNQLSLVNYLETLTIIAFCSFVIGLYWKFKFRSRYLAAELEENKQMNEHLKTMQSSNQVSLITLEGSTSEHVSLDISDLLYIESVGNYVKVCQLRNDEVQISMLRATMKQMEDTLQAYPTIVRCHRAFLVNLGQVEQISSNSRAMQLIMHHSHDAIPVSRSNISKLKELLG